MVTALACRREKAGALRVGTVRRAEKGRALSLSLSLSLYRCTALTVAEKVTEIFGQHSLFLIIRVLLLLL